MLAGVTAVAMLAVAGFVPAAASVPASGSVPASAGSGASAGSICVGLIIDAHSIGGPVTDRCVTVRPGTTGVGVLEAAGHSVTFRRDGLLCTIDGMPESGCSDVDNTHYWAYFHRAPDSTSWHYSTEGMSTYRPPNRSTEGWVYDDGTALEPRNIPASRICAGLVKPTATPTPAPTPTRSAKQRRAAVRHSPTTPPDTASSATLPARPARTSHPHRSRHAASRAATITPIATTATAAAVATSTPVAASGTSPGGRGNATGVLVAAAVVAVLATATIVGARRRRRP